MKEGRMKNDEGWRMKDEGWRMKDEGWWFQTVGGDLQYDLQAGFENVHFTRVHFVHYMGVRYSKR